MTALETVTLTGVYRNLKASVRYKRRGDTWEVLLRVGDKKRLVLWPIKDVKPCWTVACDCFDALHPAKPRKPSRKRVEAKPVLRIHA